MLDADKLIQTLLTAIPTSDVMTVAADLDVDSIDYIPFVTHATQFAQDMNGPGLYSGVLTVNLFLDPADTSDDFLDELYAGIWRWENGDPADAVVPGVGAVVGITEELNAFSRTASGVAMLNKLVTQYTGSWRLSLREL